MIRKYDFSQHEYFTFHGRHILENGVFRANFSYTGFSFRFRGHGLVISIGEPEDFENCPQYLPTYYALTCDGAVSYHAFSCGNDKIVIEGLPDDEHIVSLRKLTEGDGVIPFTGVLVRGTDPKLLTPPTEKSLKIEFVGDSITCGYGVLGDKSSDTYYSYEQDCTATYAARTAKLLGAEMRVAAISGQGICRNCNGDVDTPFHVFYRQILRRHADTVYDFAAWQPAVVVINGGTNDNGGGVTNEEIRKGGLELLRLIHEKNPSAVIVWVYGMMGDPLKDGIAGAVEDFSKEYAWVSYLHVGDINAGDRHEAGANWHPGILAADRVGPILADEIRTLLAKAAEAR